MSTNQQVPDSLRASSASRPRTVRLSLGRLVHRESADYVLLTGITVFMVIFGLVMVLSSSAVDAHHDSDNFFAKFLRQGSYALIGIPLMLVVSRFPARFWRRWAWMLLVLTCLLQLLVVATPLGVEKGNNTNWLAVGPVSFQPSEAIKLGLVVWLGMFLSKKEHRLSEWRYTLLPALLVSGASIGLVMVGDDLGTAVIMFMLVLGGLFCATIPLRHLVVTVAILIPAAGALAVASPSRMKRLVAFFQPHTADFLNHGWQTENGFYAMASGGVFGVGLGNSESKWGWLPAVDNDFIFAVIGEELGLIGAVLVLLLFVALTIVFVRIIQHSTTTQARASVGAVMVWLVSQGLVNIAVVVGLLPPLGVPLPFISAGGTALISSLIAVGIVLSFAREQPQENA